MEMLCVPGIPNENNKNAHKREIRNKNFCIFFFSNSFLFRPVVIVGDT